ncbi:hypothetical protein FB566_1839 [Stackebrandtia endophytica]|uniref:WXG100 family type VII secretion target n=1 Tax=Stackebrandtia endophytica TaxID=1496996 RepID=A0A543AUP4_9ACTN|nr:hypothetical protein [Stackebrandtia endophytica]TQL76313.1 hypothetical protein FB566_1839 [Stackebrandtia endophytica]
MADELNSPGGGYKYNTQSLTFAQIVAIVDSDYASRGRADDMAEGWRRLANLTERVQSYLDSERSLLAENFTTQHSSVFFEHLDDVITSANSAVAPAQLNADSLNGAVAEVERIKNVAA